MDNQVLEEKTLKIDKSKWKPTKLGTLAEDISVRVDKPGNSEYDRFVGLDNFISGDIKIKSWASTENLTSSAKAFKSGDILFARRNAYLRRASLVDFDGCCSGDAFVIRENLDKVVPGFLAFLMNTNSLWDYANSNAAGTMSKRVKWRDLAEYEFLLPPKAEQTHLAELLWAIDDLIEKENVVLEKLNILFQTKQSSFFNDKSYEVERIQEVAEVKRGKFTPRPRNNPKYFGGDIPFIQTAEVVESRKWIKNYTQTLNELGLTVSKMFERRTIVMTIAANIGYVGMLDFNSAFTDSLVGITANKQKILQDYLYYYLEYKREEIENLATESAQKNLSIERFSRFIVRYPKSENEQVRIIATLDKLRININSIESKIISSKSLQKSIINQIF